MFFPKPKLAPELLKVYRDLKSGKPLLDVLSEEKKQALIDTVVKSKAVKKRALTPNDGPQSDAYFSKADILLYGGHPGAGKSALGLGLALNKHVNSLIIRRAFTDVDGLFRDCKRLVEEAGYGLDGFVGGNRPVYNKPLGRNGYIAFEGLERTNGEIDYGKQGRPFDLIYVDEAAQLPQDAILMLIGWNRTVVPGQRCRMVLGSNPPLDSTGDWMAEFFAPWLDDRYPNPAKHGELRWFVMDKDGKNVEVEDASPVWIEGREYYPHSRTYIPGKLEDNPFIGSDYKKRLQLLPPRVRDILTSGNFLVARQDPTDQLIPTEWVRAAIERWREHPYPPHGSVLSGIGYDLAAGGNDNAVIGKHYSGWFEELSKKPGYDVPRGSDLWDFLREELAGEKSYLCFDGSGGYGSGLWELLKRNYDMNLVKEYKGKEKTNLRTKCKRYKFVSLRAAIYWKLREALDPDQEGGSPIMFPDDRRLFSGLTCLRYEMTPNGYKITTKEDVKDILRYSPDEADAVAMAWYAWIYFGKIARINELDSGEKNVFAKVGYENRKKRR